MLGFAIPALDLSAALQLVLTALAIVAGVLVLLKKAAPLYVFVDDENFDPSEDLGTHRRISVTGGGVGGATSMDACVVCRHPATKKCSRCKSLYYCSQVCQIENWGSHKLNCKQASLANKDDVSPNTEACRRRKSSGFSSISLVPGRGTYKVLEEPKKILFPYDEFVKLFNWDKQGFLPCGLLNCGNSCYANVVLQCLACTRPLIAYLLEKDHHRGCVRKQHDWCFLCELQVHIQRASASLHPFSPINILSRLPNIGGNLGYGRQEDAHELLRFAVDTMQSICLDEYGGEKVLDPSTQDTTLIQHIFGGHLQSQVICTKCNMISNRYENMMDLTIEIQGDAESLEECLNQFTIKEWLDGENMYKCDGCNDYVRAWKRLTIYQTPNILTIALKRFQSGRFGKLNKRVTFPETLNLTPYMSGIGDGTDVYSLYAVVVHVDMLNASFYGHYICYTKDYYGVWYRIDDCKVMKVEVEEVLSQGAYMLFYSRRTARREPFVKPAEVAKKMNLAIGREASNVSMATEPIGVESAYCLPSNTDVSLLQDTGHDRNFIIKSNSVTKKEPEDMDSEIHSDEITPMSEDVEVVTSLKPTGSNSSTEAQALEMKPILKPKDLGGMDIDYSGPCSLGTKDLEEGKSSLPPVDSSSLVEISSVLIEANEASSSPVERDSGDAGMHDIQTSMDIDYSGSCSLGTKDLEEGKSSLPPVDSSSLVEISSVVIEANEASSSPVERDSGDAGMHDIQTSMISSCSPSDPAAKRLNAVSCVSEGSWAPSYLVNGFRGKQKPLFSRGFIDRPARKENVVHKSVCDDDLGLEVVTGNGDTENHHLPCGSSRNSINNDMEQLGEANCYASSELDSAKVISGDAGLHDIETSMISSCSPSDPAAKRLNAVSCASEGSRDPSYLVNGFRRKPEPLFSRGFIDRPARKENVVYKSVCDDDLGLEVVTGNGETASSELDSAKVISGDAGMHDIQTSMITSCTPSDPSAKRLNAVSCASEGSRAPSYPVNGFREKPKPLFSRGFIDRPARKEHVVHKSVCDDDLGLEVVTGNGETENHHLPCGSSRNSSDNDMEQMGEADCYASSELDSAKVISGDAGMHDIQTLMITSCSPSVPAVKRLNAVSCASEGSRAPSYPANGFRGKPNPLFSRGFIDRPARKEHVVNKSVCDDDLGLEVVTGNGDSLRNSSNNDMEQLGEANCYASSKLDSAKVIFDGDERMDSLPSNGNMDSPLFSLLGFFDNHYEKLKGGDDASRPCETRSNSNGVSVHGSEDRDCRHVTEGDDALADENRGWVSNDAKLPSVSDVMDIAA